MEQDLIDLCAMWRGGLDEYPQIVLESFIHSDALHSCGVKDGERAYEASMRLGSGVPLTSDCQRTPAAAVRRLLEVFVEKATERCESDLSASQGSLVAGKKRLTELQALRARLGE